MKMKWGEFIVRTFDLTCRDRTYNSLIRMVCLVFAFFLVIAIIRSYVGKEKDVAQKASYLYFEKGPGVGEAFLVNYLKANPDDRNVWILLVTYHALFSMGKDGDSTVKMTNDYVVQSQRGEATNDVGKLILSEKKFLEFLELAEGVPASVLRGRYSFLKYGLSIGLKDLGELERNYEKWLAAGEMYSQTGGIDEAIDHFNQAVELNPNREEAKDKLLTLLLQEKRFDDLRRVLIDHPPRPPKNYYYWREIKLFNKDYLGMIPYIVKSRLTSYTLIDTCIAVAVGMLWFFFFFHLGRGWEWEFSDKILAFIALTLGFFSTYVCLIFVIIQDSIVGGIRPDDMMFNFLYCIGGIGFREEVTKLIFLVPLLFRLKNVESNLTIITVCSFVGLGFAVEENIAYFRSGVSSTIIARFMTANFLHMTLTGYSGYFLVKAIQYGGSAWDEFGFNLLKMVVTHGVYDWMLMDPNLGNLSFLAMTIFIYLSQLYLRQVVRDAAILRRKVSPSRLLTLVLSLVVGISFVRAADGIGILNGLRVIVYGVAGIFVVAYMFYRELGEHYH